MLPTYFISHGGGPWPWLKKEMPFYDQLEKSLAAIPGALTEKPRAVLVISGHWEESDFAVMATAHPPMIYDYGGFPAHTYQVKYSAPGAPPDLVSRVETLIRDAGFATHLDLERGYDHGTFSPMVVIYPKADVPVFQLSIRADYNPEAHLRLGEALAPLREEGVLIVASGLSYHNLRAFGGAGRAPSLEFDKWLSETLALDPAARRLRLLDWREAPSALIAHPEADHLIPLMVAVGAAESEKATRVYHEDDFMGSLTVSSFKFG